MRHELGAVAVIGDLHIVSSLPKTRSGKIMRRVLRAVTLDRDPGDISTIEDQSSVADARNAWILMKKEIDQYEIDAVSGSLGQYHVLWRYRFW